MKSVTVYSTRGGNGKTITSLFLAIAAAKRGIKTIIIDADLEAPSLIHLLNSYTSKHSWVEYLENQEISVSSIINPSKIENLDIIFTPPPKIGKAFLGWKSNSWWKDALKRSLMAKKQLEQMGYQLIILDNQSGTSYNSLNNLVFSEISIMVLRPAAYGLGATEDILREIFLTLKDMGERTDYYLWNQVHVVQNEEEKRLLDNFLINWDERLHTLGLNKLGKVDYNTHLNLSFLSEKPDLVELFNLLEDNFDLILNLIINA